MTRLLEVYRKPKMNTGAVKCQHEWSYSFCCHDRDSRESQSQSVPATGLKKTFELGGRRCPSSLKIGMMSVVLSVAFVGVVATKKEVTDCFLGDDDDDCIASSSMN